MIWRANEFKIGINMAGAISAGAYSAGVLDFLTEALDEWQTKKDALRAWLADPIGPAPELVPLHDVTIEVFSGASAGGMCAAIAFVMVQQAFTHIRTGDERNTNNTLYEAWVNTIDIQPLLGAQDLGEGKPLISLLDSTIIDEIAARAFTPGPAKPRAYISENLTLFLTLTNVRGTPYQLSEDPSSVDEFIAYYGDRLQFESTNPGAAPADPAAKPLPRGVTGGGCRALLMEAAKATGAFPIFLAPRILTRPASDYDVPPWAALCTSSCGPDEPVPKPAFPDPRPDSIQTLNVDGGVTDNNPFELAHDYLALRNPLARECHNPRPPDEVNCAVITVAPFPARDSFNTDYKPQLCESLWTMAGKLATVLISQSRFLGESLSVLTSPEGFSQFFIAPSDDEAAPGTSVLQCGLLGAFGGFFERGFRKHDYLLGRRNCQEFLRAHFCLPLTNPVIADGLHLAGPLAESILAKFKVPPPDGAAGFGDTWLNVIPCTGKAAEGIDRPQPAQITVKRLDDIAGWILTRVKKIRPLLLSGAPDFLKYASAIALWPIVVNGIRNKLQNALADGLCPNVEGQNAGDCKKNTTAPC